jgi:two-component system response regulator (stage 0 sporulation protein A)
VKENKIRTLIVDDNKEIANILSDYLGNRDEFEVVGKAENGIEALKFIASIDIDLIILDLIMPKLDGIGVLEELNNMNLVRKPKVVVLSAVGGDEYTKRALSLGANYYIIKPFDMEVFASRMIELFSDSDARVAADQTAYTLEQPKPANIDLEIEISEFLYKLGVPVHIKGYIYIKEAVEMAINDMTTLSGITKIIYPAIAAKHNTTESRVERSIRHAIEVLSLKNKTELWRKLFKSTIMNNKEKPTNGEFIGVVADTIRLRIKKGI